MLKLMRAGVWDKGCPAGAEGRAPGFGGWGTGGTRGKRGKGTGQQRRESGDTRGHHVLVVPWDT